MAISFNKESVFNLKPIDISDVRNDVNGLLIPGENIIAAFRTVRDQLVFTNKRIISVDIQGVTGKRKSFTTMPFSKIQYFTIQTPGFMELIPDSEIFIMFADGTTATFEIKGTVDIGKIGRSISEYVLEK
ncbi:MAG: PH domain-containing protein [Sphaerochaetaceae bacterium]|nr:PH domain-containing protein [Sphaerochaetaceae bacterium]